MNGKLKATLVGLGCLICCLPLIFTIVGATSGLAGAASVWLGRYDLAIIGALGLVAVIAMAVPTTAICRASQMVSPVADCQSRDTRHLATSSRPPDRSSTPRGWISVVSNIS